MNRSLTSLFAAFEALLVVAIGIGIPLAPLTVLWGVQYGFGPNWWAFWRASADIWMLGHGADLIVTLDAATAAGLGLAGAEAPFPLTLAPLGFALLTLLLGMRAGRRIAQTDHPLIAELVAVAVFAALAFGVAASGHDPLATASLLQGTLLPTLVFTLGILIGTLRARVVATNAPLRMLKTWIADWNPAIRQTVASAARGGASATAAIIAVASVAVAVLIVASYAQVFTLYEGLHAGALGGLALTIAQIAVLPNVVLGAASWLIGPGFAIGVGSSVSPLGTALGPIPAIPLFGALPAGDFAFSFVGLLVPVLAGFLAGAVLGPRRAGGDGTPLPLPWPRVIATGLGMGVVAGAALGLLAAISTGSAGPGRLAMVGPDPLPVALWAALEVGVAATLGLYAASRIPGAVTAAQERRGLSK